MSILINIAIFFPLMLMVLSIGQAALNWSTHRAEIYFSAFDVGMSYFYGVAISVVAIRTFSTITGSAHVSLVIYYAFMALVLYATRKQTAQFYRKAIAAKHFLPVALSAMIFMFMLLAVWLPPAKASDPFAVIGSLHSPRYAALVNFFRTCDFIPIIGQNTGQSIISYSGSFLSLTSPYAMLFLWLWSSLVFFCILIYGIILHFVKNVKMAFVGTFAFMMGNTALSITHVLTIDSGSPFLMNGYSDSIFGCFSVLAFLSISKCVTGDVRIDFRLGVMATLVAITDCYSAAQNVVYLLIAIPVLYALHFRCPNRVRRPVFWASVWVCACIFGVSQGGMITPTRFQNIYNIPGLMSVLSGGGSMSDSVEFHPGVPFYFGGAANWTNGLQASSFVALSAFHNGPIRHAMSVIWQMEQLFVTSFRLVAFPFVGIVTLTIMEKTKNANLIVKYANLKGADSIASAGILLLGLGFAINFFFSIGAYKWELVRFMIPGFTLGMLAVVIVIGTLVGEATPRQRRLLLGLVFVMTAGPVIDFVGIINDNLNTSLPKESIAQRMRIFLGAGPAINKTACQPSSQP